MTLSLCINSCLMQLCTRGLQGLSVHMVQVFYSSNHLGQATVTTHTFPLSLQAITTQIPLQLPEHTSLLSFDSAGLETENILLSHVASFTVHLHFFFFVFVSFFTQKGSSTTLLVSLFTYIKITCTISD